MYHRKYCDVQTLLKVTKAKVWARRVEGRECFARKGRRMQQRRSCGMKARVVRAEEVGDGVLVGEETR